MCLGEVESAKVSLVVTRRDAEDIVTRFNNASGGITSIILPWKNGVENEAHVSEKKTPSPTFLPITIPAIPVPTLQATVPPPPQKEEIPYDHYWQSTRFAAIHSTPAATPGGNGTLAVQMEDCQYSTTPLSISSPYGLSTNVTDLPPYHHRYHPCFEYYERAVTTAKSISVGSLLVPTIPWPVLTPLTGEFPVPHHHHLLGEKVLLDNMQEFICLYAEWKHVPFNEVARVMQRDWLILDSKVKPSKIGGKMIIKRVIEGFCVLMGRN